MDLSTIFIAVISGAVAAVITAVVTLRVEAGNRRSEELRWRQDREDQERRWRADHFLERKRDRYAMLIQELNTWFENARPVFLNLRQGTGASPAVPLPSADPITELWSELSLLSPEDVVKAARACLDQCMTMYGYFMGWSIVTTRTPQERDEFDAQWESWKAASQDFVAAARRDLGIEPSRGHASTSAIAPDR